MNPTAANLESIQGWMQAALMFPGSAAAGSITELLEDSPTLAAADRLAIYQRSYHLRLLRCMQEQFPALCHALGRDLFNGFARDYLRELPSESYTLFDLGRRFPDYLETARPDREAPVAERETWIDFMVDLTRFERQVYVMFDAPGHEGSPLATSDTPDEDLRLQPCFALHESRFPVAAYYHAVKNAHEPELPPRERSYVALTRQDYSVRTIPLSAFQHQFLGAMAAGVSAQEALGCVADQSGKPLVELSRAWKGLRERWAGYGLFIDSRVS